MSESDFPTCQNLAHFKGACAECFANGEKAATNRIVEWLDYVADYTADACTDAQRIKRGIAPDWVVDPEDARALAEAIRRGDHAKDMSNDY